MAFDFLLLSKLLSVRFALCCSMQFNIQRRLSECQVTPLWHSELTMGHQTSGVLMDTGLWGEVVAEHLTYQIVGFVA